MDANWTGEVDAIVIDKAFSLGLTIRPRGDGLAHAALGVRRQKLRRLEHGFLAVALHEFDDSLLAQARGADLTSEITNHQCGSTAVGCNHGFDLSDRLRARHDVYRRYMKSFLESLPRVT